MAGMSESGMGEASSPTSVRVQQQFRAVMWLRWRIFMNSLRGKGAVGELLPKILSYLLLAMMILGPSIGAGIGSWYVVSHGKPLLLAILDWCIFLLMLMVSLTTSTTGPGFDMGLLLRFPIRYRDYFLMRLSFGLMDPPNLVGLGAMTASAIGVSVANLALVPWALVVLVLFAATNFFFSRMLYLWLERWLQQRKSREIFTAVILFFSLGLQVALQYLPRFTTGRHHAVNPLMAAVGKVAIAINWLLPPGLAAKPLIDAGYHSAGMALVSLVGLAIWCCVFALLLHRRLLAQFKGESLSEAAAVSARTGDSARRAARTEPGLLAMVFSPVLAALVGKELRYLVRSGPKLYSLALPPFMIFIFSSRNTGLAYMGMSSQTGSYVFAYGCVYLEMLLITWLFNALGTDAGGVQFYFLAPVPPRMAMVAKNIVSFGILCAEIVVTYIASVALAPAPRPALIVAAIAGCFFMFFVSMTVGNWRSIVSPKRVSASNVRQQSVSGFNSLISLVLIAVCGSISGSVIVGSRYLYQSLWPAAGLLGVLALVALAASGQTYRRLDKLMLEHREELSAELCKAG